MTKLKKYKINQMKPGAEELFIHCFFFTLSNVSFENEDWFLSRIIHSIEYYICLYQAGGHLQ